MKTIAGECVKHKDYVGVELESIVGKTVQAIAVTKVDGAYGDEPMVVLYFTDKTLHGFVLPTDD